MIFPIRKIGDRFFQIPEIKISKVTIFKIPIFKIPIFKNITEGRASASCGVVGQRLPLQSGVAQLVTTTGMMSWTSGAVHC